MNEIIQEEMAKRGKDWQDNGKGTAELFVPL